MQINPPFHDFPSLYVQKAFAEFYLKISPTRNKIPNFTHLLASLHSGFSSSADDNPPKRSQVFWPEYLGPGKFWPD
jgi:hypothetical protein